VQGVGPAFGQDAAEAPFPDDAVEIGRIGGAWGVKGAFKVHAFSADPQALFSSRRWYLKAPEAALVQNPFPVLLRVTQAREQGDCIVASARDIDDRSAAEALRGARIFVSRGSFPTAGEGEYYWVDLIGLHVFNRAGDALGHVAGLLETGAQCVLRVQSAGADERLIPFVDAYVDTVDLSARRIVVDWGLDY
jgi:16S rRNA processing protein RimM